MQYPRRAAQARVQCAQIQQRTNHQLHVNSVVIVQRPPARVVTAEMAWWSWNGEDARWSMATVNNNAPLAGNGYHRQVIIHNEVNNGDEQVQVAVRLAEHAYGCSNTVGIRHHRCSPPPHITGGRHPIHVVTTSLVHAHQSLMLMGNKQYRLSRHQNNVMLARWVIEINNTHEIQWTNIKNCPNVGTINRPNRTVVQPPSKLRVIIRLNVQQHIMHQRPTCSGPKRSQQKCSLNWVIHVNQPSNVVQGRGRGKWGVSRRGACKGCRGSGSVVSR